MQDRDTGINLCINFLAGTCEFSQDCRYSHDIQAYLAQKPRELPGQCPFSAATRCPYGRDVHTVLFGAISTAYFIVLAVGITCLFASTHHHPDEVTAKYVQAQPKKKAADSTPSEVCSAAITAADAAVHAEVASGPSVELADKVPNGRAARDVTHPPVTDTLSGNTAGLMYLSSSAIRSLLFRVLWTSLNHATTADSHPCAAIESCLHHTDRSITISSCTKYVQWHRLS